MKRKKRKRKEKKKREKESIQTNKAQTKDKQGTITNSSGLFNRIIRF
jgi:hypothetical protein